MALIPFAVLWFAYQLGWYGYCTIAPYCNIGFMDLILPGHMNVVDANLAAGKIPPNGPSCDDRKGLIQNNPGGLLFPTNIAPGPSSPSGSAAQPSGGNTQIGRPS